MKIKTPTKTMTEKVIDAGKCSEVIQGYLNTTDTSMRSLARFMKISPAYLSDLMNGNRQWNEKRFRQACDILVTK